MHRASPTSDSEISRAIASATEVIDEILARYRAEEALSELRIQNDLREKFVSLLTHDLRTPLTTAKVCAELISKKLNDPKVCESLALKIQASLDRADQMITDLLDANRLKAGAKLSIKRIGFDLAQKLRSLSEEFTFLYGARFNISAPGELIGTFDPRAIRRAVENLVSNAVKYGDPKKPITLTLSESANKIEIGVHNFGKALTKKEQVSIFDWFKRTKEAQSSGKEGWGLGLILVRGIAEAHGGKVKIESDRETGTIFKILLPKKNL